MTSGRLANIASYEDVEFNNNVTEDREDRRKKEVEDLISKYAKKKDKDEVICEGFNGDVLTTSNV